MVTLKCEHSICSEAGISGLVGRAKLAWTTQGSQLAHMQLLDKYMPALKERSPFHLVVKGRLMDDHWLHCQHMEAFTGRFDVFKKAHQFERFTYCYVCSMPQDREEQEEFELPCGPHFWEEKNPHIHSSSSFHIAFGNCRF